VSESVLVTALLVFARLSSLVFAMPVFSSRGVPRYLSIMLGGMMTLLIAPAVDVVTPTLTVPWLVAAVAGEIGLGLGLGMVMSAVFAALSYGSEVMSMQVGLAMATLFNPFQQTTTGALGVMASWLAGLVFLSLGLHLHVIELVAASFANLPPGSTGMPEEGATQLVEAVGITFSLGVQLAAPLLSLVWLVNVFVGVLAKLAPRMNVFFSVGLTINSVGGIALLAFSFPWIIAAHREEMIQAVQMVGKFLDAF
jgi:flagellar biosynthetic protein FliR